MNFCVDYEQLHAFMKKHIHHCVRDKHKKVQNPSAKNANWNYGSERGGKKCMKWLIHLVPTWKEISNGIFILSKALIFKHYPTFILVLKLLQVQPCLSSYN
jgi:hypothetical protein